MANGCWQRYERLKVISWLYEISCVQHNIPTKMNPFSEKQAMNG